MSQWKKDSDVIMARFSGHYSFGIIHLQFLKGNETVNAHLYVQQLEYVHKCLVVKSKNIFLPHNNARATTEIITQEKLRNLIGQLYPPLPCRIYLTMNEAIITFFSDRCKMLWWGKLSLKANRIQEVFANIFHVKISRVFLK